MVMVRSGQNDLAKLVQTTFKSYNQKCKEERKDEQLQLSACATCPRILVGCARWFGDVRAIHRSSAPPHSDRDDRVDGSSDHTVPHRQVLPIDGSPRVPHVVGRMPHGVR